jgi:hypothetical protein
VRVAAVLLASLLLAAVAAAAAPAGVVVADWAGLPAGTRGVPPGWRLETWGRSGDVDIAVVEDEGRHALRLRSAADRVMIARDVRGQVDLAKTPVLEWRWKAVTLPVGGDARRRETTDQAAQVYVAWPRFPALLRSRVLGYVWDTTVPAGTMLPSRKTGTVTFFVLRSGPADLGRWLTERRNVREDFERAYGEAPPEGPAAVSLSTDANDTRSTAAALYGRIAFVAPTAGAAAAR